ncbi:MAG: Putative membrane protein [Desulfotomaculum sp. 46_296]|nr:MAG: Putative membrane protein [Desulfotomaculum sp. 46_296]HAU31523.1 hypothetical protein [Desulfotomaculum sp.]
MPFIKKHFLKIILLLVLLSAGTLCVYTTWEYGRNSASTQTKIESRHFTDNERRHVFKAPDQAPRGQISDTNRRQRMPAGQGMGQGNSRAGSGADYPVLVSSLAFFALFAAAYYHFVYRNTKIDPRQTGLIMLTLLLSGLFLRVFFSITTQGHPFDINLFKNWAASAANNLFNFYSGPAASDYPPLYIYILFLIGKISSIPAVSPFLTSLIKLPSILADIATSLVIYRLAKKYLTLEMSVLASAFYIFNPAVIINSAIWGQVDSFFALLVVSAVTLLSEKKSSCASSLFTAAVLMKPQGIIFLPVLFFELIRRKNLKNFLKAGVSALITAVVIVLPFSLQQDALWIFRLFSKTIAEYPYASVNAFNFFSLIGKNYVPDTVNWLGLSLHHWGMIFIAAVTAFAWFIYIKGSSRAFASAAALLLIAGVFTFSTSMHERYLFPAAALAILSFIYLGDKRLLLLSAGFSLTTYINTHVVLFATLKGVNAAQYSPLMVCTSLLNIFLFIYLAKVLAIHAGKRNTS